MIPTEAVSGSPARLRHSRRVRGVLRGGRHRAGQLVSVHVRVADRPEVALAVVASRKVGRAVDRNRAKRVMRAAARRVAWAPGYEVVMVARPACAQAGRQAVEAELAGLAEQLGVLGGAGGAGEEAGR